MRTVSRLAALLALVSAFAPAPASAHARRRPGPGTGAVVLDDEKIPVRWTDGDSFRILGGPRAGIRARLLGVNALETFGPVHRWGEWSPRALERIAKGTAGIAAGKVWTCTAAGARDGYRRLLVSCPDLALALVAAGQAMVFAVDEPPGPDLVRAQHAAQAERLGMWAMGVPERIVTSAHSADEPELERRGAYDRLVDPRTGVAEIRAHARRYRICEEVCAGEPPLRSCFLYVPYARRYRDRPACLR